MASEEHENGAVSFALPPDVGDWIAEQAERHGADRETVCRRLLVAAHAASSDESIDPPDREEIEALRGQIDAQREEFVDLLEDVRNRVVQVKRETDAKAAADHDHPDLADADDLEALEEDLADLEAAFSDLEERVQSGFANYERILDYLVDETDGLSERSELLARAVLDLREKRSARSARERRRAETESLKLAANRLGIETAVCEHCDATVDLSLLTRPECPHCASTFGDVVAKESFFGSHRLVIGSPPALEGEDENPPDAADSDDVFAAVADDVDSVADRDSEPAACGGDVDNAGTDAGEADGADAGHAERDDTGEVSR